MKTRTPATLAFSYLLFGLLLATSSQAGEIKGKVTVQRIRSAGNIAVYVDTIPGKDFTAPRSTSWKIRSTCPSRPMSWWF